MGSQRRLLEALAERGIHGDRANAVMHAIEDLRRSGDDISDALWGWYDPEDRYDPEGRLSMSEAVTKVRAILERLEGDLQVIEGDRTLDRHAVSPEEMGLGDVVELEGRTYTVTTVHDVFLRYLRGEKLNTRYGRVIEVVDDNAATLYLLRTNLNPGGVRLLYGSHIIVEVELTERWSVACGCDKHGDHLGCTQDCQDNLGCEHPLGVLITAATEAEADRRVGL